MVSTFVLLDKIGPMFSYYPKPGKWIVICLMLAEERMKAAFAVAGFHKVRFVCGHRYIGSHVGSTAMRDRWLDDKVDDWVVGVKTLAMIATKYL